MTKAALCIGVVALVMFGGSDSTFAVSSGSLPHLSTDTVLRAPAEKPEQHTSPDEASVEREEEADLSQPLTLEQCIEIALKNAPEMKTAQLDLMLEEMDVRDAQSNYWPQIDTSGSYQFSDAVDFGWEKENYDASVAARYVIWDHGQREGTLAQAKSRREIGYSRYDRTGQSLIFNVIGAYYDLLEAGELIDVDEQLLEQSRQNVEKIKAFVEAGLAIESDIATARVQQASDELSVISDRNNPDLARSDLAVLMGLGPGVPLSVVDDPDYERYMQTGVIEREEISIEDAISEALTNRPELAESRANQAILEWALTLAQLGRWPRITAECSYNVWLADYLRERDALKNHKNWDVSARVSYPVFDAGRSRRTVQRAEIAMQRIDESMAELRRSVTLEVHQAYLNLERAKKSMDIASVQVEDAKMSLDVAQGRYEQQMIILLELLDAQARYARSLTSQVRAFYDYKVARKTLEKAMGVLNRS
jgi:outer membrane protein